MRRAFFFFFFFLSSLHNNLLSLLCCCFLLFLANPSSSCSISPFVLSFPFPDVCSTPFFFLFYGREAVRLLAVVDIVIPPNIRLLGLERKKLLFYSIIEDCYVEVLKLDS